MFPRWWTLTYAAILSVVCATLLAAWHGSLRNRIELNRENERRQIILGCFGEALPPGASGAEIKAQYEALVREDTLALADGSTLDYYALTRNGTLDAIAIPIEGIGLWSQIHGYVAIEATDFATIRQVNFDRQEETPGLGGEIVAEWFRSQFGGKSIYHEDVPIRAMVAKPGQAKAWQVDGISGATITSQAVGDMLFRGFEHVGAIADQLQAEGANA